MHMSRTEIWAAVVLLAPFWRRRPAWRFLGFCVAGSATAALAWPMVAWGQPPACAGTQVIVGFSGAATTFVVPAFVTEVAIDAAEQQQRRELEPGPDRRRLERRHPDRSRCADRRDPDPLALSPLGAFLASLLLAAVALWRLRQ